MSEPIINSYKLDKTVLSVASLHDPSDEPAFWRTQSIEARWRAMELMRQINYGQAVTGGRLQRVLEIAQLQRD